MADRRRKPRRGWFVRSTSWRSRFRPDRDDWSLQQMGFKPDEYRQCRAADARRCMAEPHNFRVYFWTPQHAAEATRNLRETRERLSNEANHNRRQGRQKE